MISCLVRLRTPGPHRRGKVDFHQLIATDGHRDCGKLLMFPWKTLIKWMTMVYFGSNLQIVEEFSRVFF